jgi:hypothetical protein
MSATMWVVEPGLTIHILLSAAASKCQLLYVSAMTGSRRKNQTRHANQKLPRHLRASRALQARDEARRIQNSNITFQAELDDLIERLSDWSRHLEEKEALLCNCCSAGSQSRCLCVAPLRSSSSRSPEEPPFITRWRDSTGTPVSMMGAGWGASDESEASVAGDIESSSEASSSACSLGWGLSRAGSRRCGRP